MFIKKDFLGPRFHVKIQDQETPKKPTFTVIAFNHFNVFNSK